MRDSLKQPGAVLLVSCYELGHQPLALASPLALLRRAGYRPATLDLAIERLDPASARRARLIAISVPMHTALRLGAPAAERMRALNPEAAICFYGLYATLNAQALLEGPADAVIGGEHEEPLLRLVEHLDEANAGAGSSSASGPAELARASGLPGVRTRSHHAPPWLRRIRFAVPERDRLAPLSVYAHLEHLGESRRAGHVETSRGCLHLCRHCPIPPVYGGRFFVVPKEIVLADLRRQVESGARHVSFGDPDFLNGPAHSLAIARALHAEFPSLTFDLTTKIEHLLKHRALLPELARLGCLFIVSAVETLDDATLAILDKGHTRADILEALRLTDSAGIALRPTFVPFTPWTGLSDYLELVEFIESEGLIRHLDPVQLSIRLLVPPGSLLIDHPAMRPFLGPLDAARFTHLWTHPDPRVDRLQREVAGLVRSAAEEHEDPPVTFERIAARAAEAIGQDGDVDARPLPRPPARRDKGRPPRMTEPWFC